MMVCESMPKNRLPTLIQVSRHDVLSDRQLICSSKAPSKAWFQDQEENARRQTASVAPFVPFAEDDDNFQPIPVVNKIPGMFLALY
jgi:hypothetical protein